MRKTGSASILFWVMVLLLSAVPFPVVSWGSEVPVNLQKSLFKKMGFILFDDREKAPNFSIPDLSGKTVSLSDYRGRLVLLNFWATWCVPCRKEIPTLNVLSQKMSGMPFVLASIAMDHNIGRIHAFMKKVPIDYLVLNGRNGKVDDRYFGLGLPQTYLIDPDGYLIGKASGPRNWESPEALKLMGSLLPKATEKSIPSTPRETIQ